MEIEGRPQANASAGANLNAVMGVARPAFSGCISLKRLGVSGEEDSAFARL